MCSVSVRDSDGVEQSLSLGVANSIAVHQDRLAIAVEVQTKTDPGAVLIYTFDAMGQGSFVKAIQVGALPDMLTFSPDSAMILVANEGEPNSDCSVDPQGAISVIGITDGMPADTA